MRWGCGGETRSTSDLSASIDSTWFRGNCSTKIHFFHITDSNHLIITHAGYHKCVCVCLSRHVELMFVNTCVRTHMFTPITHNCTSRHPDLHVCMCSSLCSKLGHTEMVIDRASRADLCLCRMWSESSVHGPSSNTRSSMGPRYVCQQTGDGRGGSWEWVGGEGQRGRDPKALKCLFGDSAGERWETGKKRYKLHIIFSYVSYRVRYLCF